MDAVSVPERQHYQIKHACDKEFWALKACIRQAVSLLVDWPGSLFFLCLISFDTMLDFKPQTQLLSQQDSQGGAQKCPVRVGGDFMLLDSSISCTWWQMFRIILAIKRQSTI